MSGSISLPFPPMQLQVLHMGQGLEVSTDEMNHVTLQHPIVATHNIQVMLSSGGGYRQVATVNEQGAFVFGAGTMQLTQHARYKQVGTEYLPLTLSICTHTADKGFRKCGTGSLCIAQWLEKACAGTAYEYIAYLFINNRQNGGDNLLPVKISMTSTASIQERVALQAWLDKNTETIQTLKSCTVSTDEIYQQLYSSKVRREQEMSNVLNGMYGTLNRDIRLGNDLSLVQDTGISNADPTQAHAFLLKANLRGGNEPPWKKLAVSMARTAVLTAAEQCAADLHVQSGIEQGITMPALRVYLEANTRPSRTAQDKMARQQQYEKLINALQNIMTFLNLRKYASDETYKIDEHDNVQVLVEDCEKMDMWCGSPFMHWHLTQKTFTANLQRIKELQAEHASILQQLEPTKSSVALCADDPNVILKAASLDSLVKIDVEINELKKANFETMRTQFITPGDCEDGTFSLVVQIEATKKYAKEIFEVVKPWCGTSFIPVSSAYGEGTTTTASTIRADATHATDKVAEIQRVVELSLQLVSNALRWQAEPRNGATVSYEACLGLASAPKMDQNNAIAEAASVSRGDCSSFGDWVGHLFEGHKLGGHCFPVEAHVSDVRKLDNGATIETVTVFASSVLETTTGNVRRLDAKSRPESVFAPKTMNLTINGVVKTMANVPHAKVRAVVGHGIAEEITRTLGNELVPGCAADITMGEGFYNVFSHIGTKRCVMGQTTIDKKITMLDPNATIDAIHSRCQKTSFCNSTVAWDASPTSHKTTATTVSIPLYPQEEHRLDQLIHEMTPVFAMSQEQLAFVMTTMGYEITAGFENGVFVGTDLTGERLDTDDCVAIPFTLQTTPLTATLPQYQDEATVGAVIATKLAAAFPSITFRVKKVETGAYIVQALVAVK